jgi:hypothetical protein
MPLSEIMKALWALEDVLAKQPLTDDQRRALISAVFASLIQ